VTTVHRLPAVSSCRDVDDSVERTQNTSSCRSVYVRVVFFLPDCARAYFGLLNRISNVGHVTP